MNGFNEDPQRDDTSGISGYLVFFSRFPESRSPPTDGGRHGPRPTVPHLHLGLSTHGKEGPSDRKVFPPRIRIFLGVWYFMVYPPSYRLDTFPSSGRSVGGGVLLGHLVSFLMSK